MKEKKNTAIDQGQTAVCDTDLKNSSESGGKAEAMLLMSGRLYLFAIFSIFSIFVLAWCRPLFSAPRRVPPRRAGNFHLSGQMKVTKAKALNTSDFA